MLTNSHSIYTPYIVQNDAALPMSPQTKDPATIVFIRAWLLLRQLLSLLRKVDENPRSSLALYEIFWYVLASCLDQGDVLQKAETT